MIGFVEKEAIGSLIDVLTRKGYLVVGPTVQEEAIVYEEISSLEDLPKGWRDEQEGGYYRLKRRGDEALFGYNVGPHSWKKFLYPPSLRLWRARRNEKGFEILPEQGSPPKFAFIGVRSCELHAIAIQDQVFMNEKFADPTYKARRENCFIVAVNCGEAGKTCFCVSMKTGPKATFGFDLALTEVIEGERHFFVVQTGTELGKQVFSEIPHREALQEEMRVAEETVARAVTQMGRTLETDDIKELLYRNYENPRWEEVAKRCLTCANCTMVCPTCFCSTVEEVTDLKGEHAERWRKWDSCFTMDFSYLQGGVVRSSMKSRYRQWLTHKLATWIDQFGSSGCVGCGRCIAWCPVGIDLTEEVRSIRESEKMEKGDGKTYA